MPRSFPPSRRQGQILCSIAVLALLLAANLAPAASAAPPPAVDLKGTLAGDDAVRALGSRLGAVAAFHGMSADKLERILRTDAFARLDRKGRLFYVEPVAPAETGITPKADAGAPYPLSSTFFLHSRPGAQRVIYLDVDGHVATNTAWNNGTIDAPPFDLDGNAAGFSGTELATIQAIWQRVSEDFSPFEVDVTTQAPVASDLERSGTSDTRFGTRAVVTHSTSALCSGTCGGIAYVGTFDDPYTWAYYQPAWIFYDRLSSNEKNIAEAISHEVGHNLGLNHDGTVQTLLTVLREYYAGHGSGATAWAPIMGTGYSRPIVQWSKGEYPGASNTEDDLAIIPANGAPLRADDVGSTLATAAALEGTTASGTVAVDQPGVIERASDTDWFTFTAGPGPVQLSVGRGADTRDSDLDLSVTLRDAGGNVVAVDDEPDAQDAILNTTLAGGTYYLVIDGVGHVDSSPGYSDYASLGQYRVTGTYAAQPLPAASLDLASATVGEGDGTITVGVNLTEPAAETIQVPFTTGGTAVEGVDFTLPNGSTVTIEAGATSGALPIALVDDPLDEGNESLVLTMGTPAHATFGAVGSTALTIRDDDPLPTVSFSRAAQAFAEGQQGLVRIRLDAPSGRRVTVSLVVDGTADAGADYAPLVVPVTFGPGKVYKTISLQSLQDAAPEPDETIVLSISGASHARIGANARHTATIQDDD